MTRTKGAVLRSAVTLGVLGSILLAGLLGAFRLLDLELQSLRFREASRDVSGEVVFVDIDAGSLQQVGLWPWPRSLHAQILDRLIEMDAAEVVFDIDFSAASTPDQDAAFEAALERAGGYAYLAAFRQLSATGQIVLNHPLAAFAQHAQPVLVNVDTNGTGLVQSIPDGLSNAGIVSVARVLVPRAAATNGQIGIDYSLDLRDVVRVPAAAVLDGSADPQLIAGRQVVIGASAIELRDLFAVPRFGVIAGPLVQIAAIETLKANRALTQLTSYPAICVAIGLIVALLLGGIRLRSSRLALTAIAIVYLVEVAAWQGLALWAISVETMPIHTLLLGATVLRFVQDHTARRTKLQAQKQRLEYLATHDDQTGALSRQAFREVFDGCAHQDAVLALVRMDRLRAVTSTIGHSLVDKLIDQIAARLSAAAGANYARLDTDLFAVDLAGVPADAEAIAPRVARLAMVLDAPYVVEGHIVFMQSVFGTSDMSTGATKCVDLLRHADIALAVAQSTKQPHVHFEPAQEWEIKKRRSMDLALRRALTNDEFALVYQPQVDMLTGAVVGVEALVRWNSQELGRVSPADFIPLAEETGLISELGDWIIRQACRDAANWNWQGRLSINVSAAQFRLGDVVGVFFSALAESGFSADRLDIEITESLLVGEDTEVIQALQALRAMGARIALDDFGTGYSSLSYLSRLPFDKIKIDQSFVAGMARPENQAIIDTVVTMAGRLNKVVIAEGVETDAQRAYLIDAGCRIAQGYLFARPGTPEDIGLVVQSGIQDIKVA